MKISFVMKIVLYLGFEWTFVVKVLTVVMWSDIINISDINKVLYNNDNIINNHNTPDLNKGIDIFDIIIVSNNFVLNDSLENTDNIITHPTTIYDK